MHQEHRKMNFLKQIKVDTNDIYHIDAEKYFKKQCTSLEIMLISRMITKINKRNNEQLRMIAISNEFVYNIDKKSIKRKIAINKIFGVTISKKSQEFIIHVPTESDLLYKSQENRDVIIFYLAIAMKMHNIDGIKIYFVEDEVLQPYCMHHQTLDKLKQTSLHPKSQISMLYPENFQLNYINTMNKSKAASNELLVLFANDPLRLRVKLDEYQKSVVLASGSLSKIYLLHNKYEKQQQFSVLKCVPINTVDIDLLELFLKNYERLPFIEELELCMLYNGNVNLIFKFVKGGDLYQHLKEINNFPEQQVKQIVAQVAIALSDLHERGIIFGDLKPENILIDERGYVCLTDFGYGKLRMYQEFKKTQAINFTIEYSSPEYIKNGELTRMSDWYSLGILIYELLVGITPFYHNNFEIALKLILKGEIHFPKNIVCSSQCKDIIQRLIKHDSTQRLGFLMDFKEVQSHPWFHDVSWEDLSQKKYDTLAYIPQFNEISQISDRYFTMEQLNEDERSW
ncbi:unnamed protein product (macronuclear) [Paramecium tetraurelia]|uniref:Protein kinase domain-containing protein n=1 Tax=Paramecium tetraurelia TaxID=5888 RepID=A0E6Z7_PARTE|nr:uncharacterized protein GSPATT00023792001 [Paramecium tetraurelia]CAK91064.1 unnamed protein product [Paramecium tetraurelia]|eukprot:XP_001458461.1 hypothetical protein (macronuclear) [Paramecium tetraurelia strain d4-2]